MKSELSDLIKEEMEYKENCNSCNRCYHSKAKNNQHGDEELFCYIIAKLGTFFVTHDGLCKNYFEGE